MLEINRWYIDLVRWESVDVNCVDVVRDGVGVVV